MHFIAFSSELPVECLLYPWIVLNYQNQAHVCPLEESWMSAVDSSYQSILYRCAAFLAVDRRQVVDSYDEMTKPRHFRDIFVFVAAQRWSPLQNCTLISASMSSRSVTTCLEVLRSLSFFESVGKNLR